MWSERLNIGIEIIKDQSSQEASYQRLVANSIYKRTKALMNYTPSYRKLKSHVKLLKPTNASVIGLPEDYGLSDYFDKSIEVQTFEGNHVTILENEKVAEAINDSLPETSGSARK